MNVGVLKMYHRHVLATEIEDTLMGDAEALQELISYFYLRQQVPYLVYITDKDLQTAKNFITNKNLPSPDVLITDTGSAVYIGYHLKEDLNWKRHLQINWEPEFICKLGEVNTSLIRQNMLNKNKISFMVQDSKKVQDLQRLLIKKNISHKLIYYNENFIDILPFNSGKGMALHYALKELFHDNIQVLVAGCSEKDSEMLTLGYPSVIVGNALPETKNLEAGPTIYKAENKYAAGIKEGWKHFYP